LIRSQITYAHEAGSPLPGVLERMDSVERPTPAALYERHLGDLFRDVLRRVGQREEAEDITAEVFAAAIQALPRFRGQCPPHLWLFGIARRQIAIALRRRAVRRETLVSEVEANPPGFEALLERMAVEGPETALARAEARAVLRKLLDGLSADQREALTLQYAVRDGDRYLSLAIPTAPLETALPESPESELPISELLEVT
jgi:RNA polymerase sigma factor (sigma-70 family)